MKLLLIDNHRDANCVGALPLRRELAQAASHTGLKIEVHTRRGPEADFFGPIRAADALVISGSATSCLEQSQWIEKQLTLIREFVAQDRPVLGVCFGHQLLARALWGRETCRKSRTPEKGWISITRTPELQADPVLGTLPAPFWTYASHGEEITLEHTPARSLLQSEHCANHAFRVPHQRAWGIQFHPEKSPSDLIDEGVHLRDFRSRPPQKMQVYDSKVGLQIFSNFLELLRTPKGT